MPVWGDFTQSGKKGVMLHSGLNIFGIVLNVWEISERENRCFSNLDIFVNVLGIQLPHGILTHQNKAFTAKSINSKQHEKVSCGWPERMSITIRAQMLFSKGHQGPSCLIERMNGR